MTVWLLIVTIGGVPVGARYDSRQDCEDAALKVHVALVQNTTALPTIECIERVKVGKP